MKSLSHCVQCKIIIDSLRWIVTAGHCLSLNATVNVNFGVRPNAQHEQTITVDVAHQHKYPDFFLLPMLFDIGESL